jgi:hypothetical protein
MIAKFYSKTHLQNTFFVFLSRFVPRLTSKFAKSANRIPTFFVVAKMHFAKVYKKITRKNETEKWNF